MEKQAKNWLAAGAVITIVLIAGFLLFQSNDPQLENVQSPNDNSETNITLINAQLLINNKQVGTIAVPQGSVVLDVMNAAQQKGNLQFTSKQFEDLGVMIDSVNGETAGEKSYWSFYVNDAPAQVGVSEQKVNDGDKIEWKLETFE